MKKPVIAVISDRPTCSSCAYFKKMDRDDGLCYRYPPVPVMDDESTAFCMRPQISIDDEACGEFLGKQ